MKWQETNQSISTGGKEANAKMSVVDAFSPETATELARRMYRREYQSWGDEEKALTSVGFQCGLTPRSLKRLIKGETKDPGLRVFGRIAKAYLDHCSRQFAALQTELEEARARYGNAALEDFEDEVAALGERLRAARDSTKRR